MHFRYQKVALSSPPDFQTWGRGGTAGLGGGGEREKGCPPEMMQELLSIVSIIILEYLQCREVVVASAWGSMQRFLGDCGGRHFPESVFRISGIHKKRCGTNIKDPATPPYRRRIIKKCLNNTCRRRRLRATAGGRGGWRRVAAASDVGGGRQEGGATAAGNGRATEAGGGHLRRTPATPNPYQHAQQTNSEMTQTNSE